MQQFSSISNGYDNKKSSALIFGNRTADSFFNPIIQSKLAIGPSNDIYEQEADAMADKVMWMTDKDAGPTKFFKPAISSLQRKCGHCEEEENKIQRKEIKSQEAGSDTMLEDYVGKLNNDGQMLPEEVRSFYEPRIGYDFSRVKIHTDSVAAKSAQSINALAYTSGNNIVFNSGRYAPNTESGKRLLGHELTHVVQAGESSKTINKKDNTNNDRVIRRVPQETTLQEAKKKGVTLSTQSLSTMDVITLSSMSNADRRTWYVDKLGAYENQLKESANNYVVPVQLLATVILNELADINAWDILQSSLAVSKGSLGIGQIQIDTAIKDNLFSDLTEAESKQAYREMVINPQPTAAGKIAARIMENDDKDKRMGINKRLQIPQYSIEAAAKEIRILLNQMMANTGKDWQTRYGFTHTGIAIPGGAQAIYKDVGGATQREKELNLSTLITGAYNSPGIIAAANSAMAVFPNANIHGTNSRMIAGDLFDFGLFRP